MMPLATVLRYVLSYLYQGDPVPLPQAPSAGTAPSVRRAPSLARGMSTGFSRASRDGLIDLLRVAASCSTGYRAVQLYARALSRNLLGDEALSGYAPSLPATPGQGPAHGPRLGRRTKAAAATTTLSGGGGDSSVAGGAAATAATVGTAAVPDVPLGVVEWSWLASFLRWRDALASVSASGLQHFCCRDSDPYESEGPSGVAVTIAESPTSRSWEFCMFPSPTATHPTADLGLLLADDDDPRLLRARVTDGGGDVAGDDGHPRGAAPVPRPSHPTTGTFNFQWTYQAGNRRWASPLPGSAAACGGTYRAVAAGGALQPDASSPPVLLLYLTWGPSSSSSVNGVGAIGPPPPPAAPFGVALEGAGGSSTLTDSGAGSGAALAASAPSPSTEAARLADQTGERYVLVVAQRCAALRVERLRAEKKARTQTPRKSAAVSAAAGAGAAGSGKLPSPALPSAMRTAVPDGPIGPGMMPPPVRQSWETFMPTNHMAVMLDLATTASATPDLAAGFATVKSGCEALAESSYQISLRHAREYAAGYHLVPRAASGSSDEGLVSHVRALTMDEPGLDHVVSADPGADAGAGAGGATTDAEAAAKAAEEAARELADLHRRWTAVTSALSYVSGAGWHKWMVR